MPSRAAYRVIWAAVLVLIAVLGLHARDNLDLMFAGVGKLDVRVAPAQEKLLLRWRGKIDAPMASRIAEAFERNKAETRTVVLSLASPGGSLGHGAEVVRLLRQIARTHAVDTVVEGRSICASMCLPVFLQGQRRTASANARFMFHEVSFREFHSEEEIDVPRSATHRETDRLFKRYFEAADVPRAWIRKVRAEMAGGHDVWKTGRELVAEKAGIVQEVF